MSGGMDVFEVSNEKLKKLPKWARSVLRDDEGALFVPGIIGASEMEIMLCAGWDGTSIVEYRGHVFVSMDWLLKEFTSPEVGEICGKIRSNVKKHIDEGG